MKEVATEYWHRLEDGRVQCDLCPRACKLHEGQRGLCYLRGRKEDQIKLLAYGYASGFHVDPIEKKPLNHFLPGTTVLSFGTIGCNLRCKFCQNWHLSAVRDDHVLEERYVAPADVVRMAKEAGCRSVAFTYNEPTITLEYVVDVAKACQEAGLKTVIVTNGYVCAEPREALYRYMDAANIDLKAFTEHFYDKVTGGKLQPILETLEYVKHQTNTWLEITTLLIPGYNDGEPEIQDLTHWLVEHIGIDTPLHFSGFYPAFKMMDVPPTPLETLQHARNIAIKNGMRYVYTGNRPDREGTATYCHQCGHGLIQRAHYLIESTGITSDGRCQQCHTQCAGVFA